jgi:non-ribosomal peptide synthetase component F
MSADTALRVIATVEATLRELHAGDPQLPPVHLSSVLDRDLGFDSLGRMELLLRTERVFGVDLPADTLQRAETVADLLCAVQQALLQHGAGPTPPVGTTGHALPGPLVTPASPDPNTAQSNPPAQARTLLDVLAWHLQMHPDQTQLVVLADDTQPGSEQRISYRQLADASAAVATGLQRAGVVPRQCVAIMLATSADYFSTYFGILMAGAIPVPIYPPARASQLEDHVLRHGGILDNARAVMLVTVAEAMVVARLLQARVPGLRHVVTPQQLAEHGGTPAPVSGAR